MPTHKQRFGFSGRIFVLSHFVLLLFCNFFFFFCFCCVHSRSISQRMCVCVLCCLFSCPPLSLMSPLNWPRLCSLFVIRVVCLFFSPPTFSLFHLSYVYIHFCCCSFFYLPCQWCIGKDMFYFGYEYKRMV